MKTIYYSSLRAFLFVAVLLFNINLLGQIGIKDCANGFHHSLLIGWNDSLYVFGENTKGQCGDASILHIYATQSSNVKSLGVGAGYNYSFYIKTDSTIMASGSNTNGELGIGNNTDKNVWTALNIATSVHFKQVAASSDHALAVTGNGLVYAWGDNQKGEIGDNTTTQKTSPTLVLKAVGVNLSNIKKVAAGSPDNDNNTGGHSLALANDGTLWAWGLNANGQLGNNSTTNTKMAVQVVGIGGTGFLANVIDIAASGSSSYALLSDSTVVSWGENSSGQLGDGSTSKRSFPNRVKINSTTNITSVKQITASSAALSDDVLAMLKSDGRIWNVGANNRGQLGTGNTTSQSYAVLNTPTIVRHFTKIVGTGHYLIQLSADSIGNYCESGHQTNGSFGDGSATNTNITSSTCLSIPIAALPVTLSAFSAKRTEDKTVVLRWTTVSEISNDRFEIEYSIDGSEYDMIGILKGNGTSFNANEYQYIQKDADSKRIGYYRLKQVDFNGAYEYHNVIVVKPGVEIGNVYSYPNPTKGNLSVNLIEEINTDYSITLMDQTGRIILEKTGHINTTPVSEKFDLNGYDRGFYFVTINTSYGTKIEKIVKQ